MKRFLLRFVGLTTGVTALGATFATTGFAAMVPFMPCCHNPATGAVVTDMICCLQKVMECCSRYGFS
jgi:hypothetical protein